MSETTDKTATPQANGHVSVPPPPMGPSPAPEPARPIKQTAGKPKPQPYEPDPEPPARPVILEAAPAPEPAGMPFGGIALGGLLCGIAGGLLYIGLDLMTGGKLSAMFGGRGWDDEPEGEPDE